MKKVLRFTAEWCPACNKLSETFTNFNPSLPVEVYDYDKTPEPFVEHRIAEIPTMLMIEDGVVLKKATGAKTVEELNEWFNT